MRSLVHYFKWDECPTTEVSGEVQRRVIATRNIMIVRYKYEPGAVYPEHYHPQEQIVLVIDGEIEFEVDGERYPLTSGRVLVIPSNAPHCSRVVGKKQVTAFNIFHPIKEELLKEVGN